MASGFKINKQGIAQFTREIQREFDRHPIRIPVETDDEGVGSPPAWRTATNYYGPVVNVHGGRAQLAWGNETVIQNQSEGDEIASGFEGIAQAVASTLQGLPGAGLDEDDLQAAEGVARDVLAEVVHDAPDRTLVQRGVAMVKGLLSPLALGMRAGASDGSKEWARTAIEQLGTPF